MKFRTNIGSVSGKNFEPLPTGKYIAEIVEATPDTASTGTPFLNLDFLIEDGAHRGRHVWTKIFLTEKASWKLSALLNAIDEPPTEEIDTALLLGRRVVIIVKVKEDSDGVERNDIAGFRRLEASTRIATV